MKCRGCGEQSGANVDGSIYGPGWMHHACEIKRLTSGYDEQLGVANELADENETLRSQLATAQAQLADTIATRNVYAEDRKAARAGRDTAQARVRGLEERSDVWFQRALKRATQGDMKNWELEDCPTGCRCRSQFQRTGRHIEDCPSFDAARSGGENGYRMVDARVVAHKSACSDCGRVGPHYSAECIERLVSQLAAKDREIEILISHLVRALVGDWRLQDRLDAVNFMKLRRDDNDKRRLWRCHARGCNGFADAREYDYDMVGYIFCRDHDPENYEGATPGRWKAESKLAGLCESLFTVLNNPAPEMPHVVAHEKRIREEVFQCLLTIRTAD